MENFRTEQMINSETVRSLAESVERLASIVAKIQTNVKSEAKVHVVSAKV
jgi:alkylhydroperoxidase/carboxymuconolactone decarboxylase family protein YurZ